ncbi:Transcriptional regulator [Sphingobium herbicidovorans NBRC 16415]|uniref:Transcriptional regulator n=1 Tax=Sphingobium herbicidovorans (strain ATCC 700291 / DSM 11019 / CCUG 56400 / KCTC 2939 / LMG 18315 / NBRC 16415 / MH) TaxID=1219045 RepID=A0A086P4L0_SPHHM|nr:helix-turn-helix domain-containing protein [Sphingobium herbicidovorans]KFG88328.1 Transcriptional regulator [Sphingobium herbicidovorans NBRC 16415]
MARPALAASRAIDILNFMAASPLRGYSLTELVRHLDLNPASCHALLGAMTRDGYLVRAQRGRTYRLGPALIAIGHAALQCHPVVAAARDQIARMSAELDLDSLLTARLDDRLIALASEGPGRMPGLRIGQRVPLIPPLGTPFLAWADKQEVDNWLGRAAGSIEPDRLRQSLAMVRQRGYAVTRRSPQQGAASLAVLGMAEEPLADDRQQRAAELIGQMGEDYLMIEAQADRVHQVDLISAPIFGPDGAVLCTLSLFGFDRPMSLSRIAALGEAVGRHCRAAMENAAGPGKPTEMNDGVGEAECVR